MFIILINAQKQYLAVKAVKNIIIYINNIMHIFFF